MNKKQAIIKGCLPDLLKIRISFDFNDALLGFGLFITDKLKITNALVFITGVAAC